MYAMLPSQAVWVFDFVWSVLVPCVADPRVLVCNEQITTDGNNKIYNPFVALIPHIYPRSVHQLCTYHTFTQTWPQNGITTLRIKSKADKGVTILDVIKFWTLTWTTDVESPKEMDVSYNLLQCFLEDDDHMKCFDKMFPTDVCWVIAKNIWPHRDTTNTF
jgi:hypothetical protein